MTPLLAAVLVALMAAEQAGTLEREAGRIEYQADLYTELDDAVAAAGGREAVLGCGPVHTAPYTRPALAWRLGVPIPRLSTEPTGSGTVFRARPSATARVGPRIHGTRLRQIARTGEWTVLSSCARPPT